MKLIQISEIRDLTSSELNSKIVETKKYLFELKFKQGTKQTVQAHLFKKYKRMLAQLLTIQHKQ